MKNRLNLKQKSSQVELNDKGQIEMEESFIEAVNLTASTDTTDNAGVTSNSEHTDTEATASVLSIDDKENGDIYRDHLINNHNLNNNVIDNTNKLNDDSGVIESIAENDAHNVTDESLKLDNDTDKHNGLLNNSSNDAVHAVGFLIKICFLLIFVSFPRFLRDFPVLRSRNLYCPHFN